MRPGLGLLDSLGNKVATDNILRTSASLLDNGVDPCNPGIGGFHLACAEQSSATLKKRLGRTEQPFAIMVKPEIIDEIVCVSEDDRAMLTGPERPIVVMPKRDPSSHTDISNLHTIGCMLPYTGLHHLLLGT